jgi:hypothetical protein
LAVPESPVGAAEVAKDEPLPSTLERSTPSSRASLRTAGGARTPEVSVGRVPGWLASTGVSSACEVGAAAPIRASVSST